LNKRTLKRQISFSIAAVALVIIILISLTSHFVLNQQFKDYVVRQQKEKTQEIVSLLSEQYDFNNNQWHIDGIHIIGMYALYDGYIIRVYEPDGTLIWDVEQYHLTICKEVMTEISETMKRRYPTIDGKFLSNEYMLVQQNQEVGMVSISYFGPYYLSESEFQFLDALNSVLIIIGVLALIISLIIGWMIAKWISRPITEAIHATKKISEGNYEIQIETISRTEELNQLIVATNDLVKSLNKQELLRKQLTADVAHELRTPITTIGTHLEAMIEGIWKPTEERLQSCYEEINRIMNVVQDLECLAKVEVPNLKLNRTQVNLRKVIQTVCDNFKIEIENKSLTIFMESEVTAVYVDKERMSQVMVNLISNAIKYTPEAGQIRITSKETEDEIMILVEDNGFGIPEAEIPYIFERFYRADKSRNRKTGGAGVGLAIVKSIITAHGGTITVKSQLNQGSCFKIILPKIKNEVEEC